VRIKRLKHCFGLAWVQRHLWARRFTVLTQGIGLLIVSGLSQAQVINDANLWENAEQNSPVWVSCEGWLALTAAVPTVQRQHVTPQERQDIRLEQLLIQTSLGQVIRQSATLHLRVNKQHYQLTDQCDEQHRVRYRLQDIRHLNLTWIIREETAQQVRYLLISPMSSQLNGGQLVVNSLPVFSPHQQSFVVMDEQTLDGAVQYTIRLYDWHLTGWQRSYEQVRLQVCRQCRPRQWADAATPPYIEWQENDQVWISSAALHDEPTSPSIHKVLLRRIAPQSWQMIVPE